MLGERKRQRGGEFESSEVVAICDHLIFLRRIELEHEVLWKSHGVAADLLVQALGGYAVDGGQIGVEHDALAANEEYPAGEVFHTSINDRPLVLVPSRGGWLREEPNHS